MADTKLDRLKKRMISMYESSAIRIEQHTGEIRENPGYAMEWSDKLFVAAAESEFSAGWLAFLNGVHPEGVDPVKYMERGIKKTVLRGSRNISNNSTSVSSNYMNQCRLAVAARVLDDLFDGD